VNPLLTPAQQRDLVLASGSPRRASILRMLEFEFDVVAAGIDELDFGHPDPEEHVQRLAATKAKAASASRQRGLFLGADTVVVVDGEILEKPADAADALAMHRRLRGRWHRVYTGVALFDLETGKGATGLECTEVHFEAHDDAFLQRYVASGEGLDKAGAYAIQGLGAMLVREIRGDYFNVMGLPIGRLVRLWQAVRPAEG